MNSFSLLLVCAQALLIQYTYAQGYCGKPYPPPCHGPPAYPGPGPIYPPTGPICPAPGPIYPPPGPSCPAPGPIYPPSGPICPAPGPIYPPSGPICPQGPHYPVPAPACSYPGPIQHITLPETCNFSLNGDNLLIDGTVEISGSIPFMSHVQLDGNVPCDGVATVQNSCYCGEPYLH